MYRQKGTGNARAEHRRSGVRRGGGHIFARRPRDYSYRLPRKAVRLATRMALSSKFQDGQADVLSGWECDVPRTRVVAGALSQLGVSDSTVLIATDGVDQNVYRSARNIAGVQVLPVSDLNAYSLLRNRNFVVTVSAMDALLGRSSAAAE